MKPSEDHELTRAAWEAAARCVLAHGDMDAMRRAIVDMAIDMRAIADRQSSASDPAAVVRMTSGLVGRGMVVLAQMIETVSASTGTRGAFEGTASNILHELQFDEEWPR